ncbi:uncharacterized protein K02A2.6-like [Leptopilina heterotoma]|uniref:uncharacterized protein K02A2.6-like n=1 Tax=Leptopilina heterotoma TaxID=63436 RepID=UPI001CA82551|nr:uncharacterized protein K02A2.6-like [Leptopilina heterotoma]
MDMSGETIYNTCKRNFSRHGIPERVCSDNGTNFENKLMKKLGEDWGFELVTSAPKHQRGNVKAEATVKIAKRLVKKADTSKEDLWYMLLHWRNTPNKIDSSPNQRIFSRRTHSGVPMTNKHLQPQTVLGVPEKIDSNKKISKKYYDKKTKDLPKLNIGQGVAVQLNPEVNKSWVKGDIVKKVKDRDYIVNVGDRTIRRNIVHIKPFTNLLKKIFKLAMRIINRLQCDTLS